MFFFLTFICAIPFILKAILIQQNINSQTNDTSLYGIFSAITNDAIIYGLIYALLYISLSTKLNFRLAVLLRLLPLSILLIYITDFLIFTLFYTRLAIEDIAKYAGNAGEYLLQWFSHHSLFKIIIYSALGTVGLMVIYSYFWISTRRNIKIGKYHNMYAICLLLLLPSLYISKANGGTYVHQWVYQNIFDYTLISASEARQYSPEFLKHQASINRQAFYKTHCLTNTPQIKNIILLQIESFSAFQSQFFSGLNNWTPAIDDIAQHNIAFTNFFANGFNTEDGQISLLTGLFPLPKPGIISIAGNTSFKGFYNYTESVPNVLKAHDYHTAFLTGADVKFSNVIDWLKSIGFDYVEGSENHFYDKAERFQIKSVADRLLLQRSANWVNENASNKPFFLYIATMSTHHPFIHPVTHNTSIGGAFQYTDAEVGTFHQALKDSGYFKNGLLIIVGDHRAMVPISNEEIAKYGLIKAMTQIPMIISYGGLTQPERVEEAFQQVDIANSLKNLVSDSTCVSDWQGDLLTKPRQPAKFILYRRGDTRNLTSIFSGNATYTLKLDGDDTQLINSESTDITLRQHLTDVINFIRTTDNTKSLNTLKNKVSDSMTSTEVRQ